MKTLPAGKYWIGDPCYVLKNYPCPVPDDSWEHETANGDGIFFLKDVEEEIYVDSGMVAIMPSDGNTSLLGGEVVFIEPVRCSYIDGTFFFESGKRLLVLETGG